MKLRPYQEQAVNSIYEEWKEHQSCLAVAATGLGKTQIFCSVAERAFPKRTLVLVHRQELAFQAIARLESFGIEAEIEMANYRAASTFWNRAPAVVSTVQTQAAGNNGEGRMARFDPKDFGVVICDEAHHFTSPQFKKVLDYYKQNPELKILGVTATPDRADEQALGQVFESVAFDYDVLDGINHGWLVPIKQQMVTIEGLDFSMVRTTAGDLNGGDLAAVLEAEKNLHGIAGATIDIVGQRKTIVFTASVKQAEMLSEIFNRHRMGMSDWVCGATPKEHRRQKLEEFSSGKTQIMVNCAVLGEGFDNPGIEVVIQARPTKSRCLYSQQVGRATRPLPGIVDGIDDEEGRKFAIANSSKPFCLVVDFAGNSGRHKLMTTADILGGKYSDEEILLAEKTAQKQAGPVDMTEELEKAHEEIEEKKRRDAARRARLVAKAAYSVQAVNPFDVLDIRPARERGWDSNKTISEKQAELLRKQGIDPSQLSFHQAKQVIAELFRRWDGKLATFKQVKILKKHGYDTKDLTMKKASELIDSLSKNGWNRERAEAHRKAVELVQSTLQPAA